MTAPSSPSTLPVLLVVLLATGTAAGAAVAVNDVAVTSLTNAEVESGATVTHTITITADGVSTDGSEDVIFVVLPDVYAGNVSVSTAAFENRSTGATVPISSSTTVVDGPDGDGVEETLRTAVSHDADYATDELRGNYSLDLSHPAVSERTSYDVTVVVEDSSTPRASTTATDAITVLPPGTTPAGTVTGTSDGDGGAGTTADGTEAGDGAAGDDGAGTETAPADDTATGAVDGTATTGDATGGDDSDGGLGGLLPLLVGALVVLLVVGALAYRQREEA